MDYKLADRFVSNVLYGGGNRFPLTRIEVALRTFAFDFPRSVRSKYVNGSRCHMPISHFTRPTAPKPSYVGRCDSGHEIPAAPGEPRSQIRGTVMA
jgi:hypothetical protein